MVEYIGIDIGGTNIRVGGIDKKNNLVCMSKEKTLEGVNSSASLYAKIKRMIQSITEYESVKGIGIGFPGAVDESGNIMTARNVKYLKDFPLKSRLEKDFKVPVEILNDARVAALAEAKVGAGKKCSNVTYITISTGLGGGAVVDGKVYAGGRNLGGYFSRMILDGENMAEYLLSGTSLLEKANKAIGGNILSTQEIFALAKKNKEAEKIVTDFKKNLLTLLLNISITLSPEIIVIGGGVMNSKKYFLKEVIEDFKSKAHRFAVDTQIVEAKLKEPGVIGAALYVKEKDIM